MEKIEETLRVRLSMLLLDKLSFNNTSLEFQRALEERFKVLYTLDEINDELEVLSIENQAEEELKNGRSNFLYTHLYPDDYDY